MSLEELTRWADDLQRQVNDSFEFHQIGQIKDALGQLSAAKKKIDTVLNTVCTAYASINSKYQRRLRVFRAQIHAGEEAKATSSESIPGVEFAPMVPARDVIIVPRLSDVSISPIYWVEELQQFVLRLPGCTLRGNIGNIYSTSHHHSMTKITPCRYGSRCRNFVTADGCQYYHDPIETPGLATLYKRREVRNFTNGSFLYCGEQLKASNRGMRHVGNRSTFSDDITSVTTSEAQMWADQTMHSILTTMALAQCGKLLPSPYIELSTPVFRVASIGPRLSPDRPSLPNSPVLDSLHPRARQKTFIPSPSTLNLDE